MNSNEAALPSVSQPVKRLLLFQARCCMPVKQNQDLSPSG